MMHFDPEEILKSAYNSAYLLIHENFNKTLSKNEAVINSMAIDIISDKYSQGKYASNRKPLNELIKEVKVEIIKEYYNLNNISDPEKRISSAHLKAKENQEVQLAHKDTLALELSQNLNLIPKKPFSKPIDNDFKEKKASCLREIQTDTSTKYDDIKKILQNPDLKKFAEEIDADMEKDLTLYDFAELVGSTYEERLRAIHSNKKSTDVANTADICIALILLQKNDQFSNAVKYLDGYSRDDCNLGFTSARVMPHMLAIYAIESSEGGRIV